jgi:hypothetical protein
MELRIDEVILIRRYLLGEVAGQDQSLIEERLLTDGQYFNQLARIEEELTDQYVRGELSKDDRVRFENHFMNASVRREGVAFAEALHKYVTLEEVSKTVAGRRSEGPTFLIGFGPRWRVAMEAVLVGTVLLLIVATGWLLTQTAQLKRQIAEIGAEQVESRHLEQELKRQLDEQRSRSEDLARQLNSSLDKLAQKEREIARKPGPTSQNPTEADLAFLALSPGLSRDTTRTRAANLSSRTRWLRLELEIDHLDHASYRAEVQTAEGGFIWSRDALRASQARSGSAVVITLPATLLTGSDYLVALSVATAGGAYERIGTYYFRAIRK